VGIKQLDDGIDDTFVSNVRENVSFAPIDFQDYALNHSGPCNKAIVARVIETDDILFRLIVAADDGEFLDVKPATLHFLDGTFCCGVLAENCNH
jgi:hypothetical protein